MANIIYIIGDGDGIRRNIELYLLNSNFDRLSRFSASLINSIAEIANIASQTMDAKIIYAGGDDIFFTVDMNNYQEAIIKKLMAIFTESTGCTISFGVGETVKEAFINLRLAKAGGVGGLASSVRNI
jgi:CRISPR/Cas system-associated protein Cas10 (large subunit of type III CRISPR-Cas system)